MIITEHLLDEFLRAMELKIIHFTKGLCYAFDGGEN